MTQLPPVPEASTSPFPIEEPPHRHVLDTHFEGAEEDSDKPFSLGGLLDDIGIDGRTVIGIGAAVGLGALAGISALLFSANRRRNAATGGRRKSAAAARAPRTRKTGTTRSTRAATAAKPATKRTRRKADA